MHQAFNFEYLQAPWRAATLREVISRSLAAADAVGAPSTWVLSNHDVIRHPTRLGYPPETQLPKGIGEDDPQPDGALGLRRARAATLLMLALPGSAYLYQGEELGLPEHTTLPDAAREDPAWRRSGRAVRGRAGCRSRRNGARTRSTPSGAGPARRTRCTARRSRCAASWVSAVGRSPGWSRRPRTSSRSSTATCSCWPTSGRSQSPCPRARPSYTRAPSSTPPARYRPT